jgi:uncharacterized protein (TIRG00374 family)
MRKIITALVSFLAIGLVIFSFSELENTAATLQKSNWLFVLAALAVELLWLLTVALTYQSFYRQLGLDDSLAHLTLVVAAVNFVNVVAPTAGMGGMALFVDSGRKRGQPSGLVTAAGALFLFFDYLAFIFVLALGLVVLIRRHNLSTGEVTASLLLVIIASILGILLYIGSRSASRLGTILARMTRRVNGIARPFIKRNYLDESRAHTFASEIAQGLAGLRDDPWRLLWPLLFSLANKALLITILMLTFLAFDVPFSAGTIIAGFAIGYLFLIVSPTPAGVGVVEGVLALALNSLRVEWSQAVIVTLVYRAITFWFQLAAGAAAFRLLNRHS